MKKKIFFFGTPNIAVPSLKELSKLDNIEIIGVGVFPDRKVGRKQILTPCPVKVISQRLNLPITEINNKEDLISIFNNNEIDLGIVIAFGMIFPKEILNKPKFGVVNVHFSLLPKYRGASPVQSSILAGEKTSGITFQKMVKELDAGDILLQKEFEIQNKKTSEVFEEFSHQTAKLFPSFLDQLFNSKITPLPQDKSKKTLCTKFKKSDGEIFPKKETATEIWQKYLALDMWPGIYLQTRKGNLKLTEISLFPTENSFGLNCVDNTKLFIQQAQLPGKKAMDVQDVLRGNKDLFS